MHNNNPSHVLVYSANKARFLSDFEKFEFEELAVKRQDCDTDLVGSGGA